MIKATIIYHQNSYAVRNIEGHLSSTKRKPGNKTIWNTASLQGGLKVSKIITNSLFLNILSLENNCDSHIKKDGKCTSPKSSVKYNYKLIIIYKTYTRS